MGEIRVLKISTGEEIIAEVGEKIDEDGERGWVLNNPLRLGLNMEGSLVIAPLPPYVKGDTMTVRTNHIAYCQVPADELLEYYKQKVGKIVLPPSKLIV
jgi:hypothetical protein